MRLRPILRVAFGLLIGLAALFVANPAGALQNPDYTAPPPPSAVSTPPSPQPVRQPEQSTQREVTTAVRVPLRSRMAITGSDVTQTAVIGAVLVGLGAVVLVARRRTTVLTNA